MRIWLGCALVWIGSGACVSSPRAATDIAQKADPVTFAGVFEIPEVDLELQAKNQRTGEWIRFGTARTRVSDSVLGGAGSTYFRYAQNAVLPQAPDYWIPHPKSGRIEAHVRVAHGDRVLTTFEADAERCARRAQELGKSEQDTFQSCAAKDPTQSRIFVSSCGGVGEACCPVQSTRAVCSAAYSCRAGVCVEPSYPVPSLSDYRVDLSIPPGHRLRDAWLVMDDREQGEDTRRPLLRDYRADGGVEITSPHPNIARLAFDLAFFKPGVNRFVVQGVAAKGNARRTLTSAPIQLDYAVPRTLGLSEPGRFALPVEHFPVRMSDCHGLACKDADKDGLNDLWENLAVNQLRPRLQLDRDDGLFRSRSDNLRVLTSSTPLYREGQQYVLFASVIAFSRDYGHLGAFDHAGDTEGFGMMYRVAPDGGLTWVASAAKGHACLTCAARYTFFPQDFAEDGTPLVFVERDKHGLWQNGRQCRARAAFSCRADRSLRPAAVNVGDPSPDGSRALIDSLDGIAMGGPFGQLAGVFPGDAVWSASLARVHGRFCGGRPGCSARNSSNLPGAVIARLMHIFSSRSFN